MGLRKTRKPFLTTTKTTFMQKFSIKRTLLRGIALAVPVGIVVYLFLHFVGVFEKKIAPIAEKFGIEHIWGELTLTVLAIIALLVFVFLLGLLMQLPIVASFRNSVEEIILKVFPSLNHLKLMAAEKLNAGNATSKWKPALIKRNEQYSPAYIIEESSEWITYVPVKVPTTEPGDMVLVSAGSIRYQEITMKQLVDCNKQFGKGYQSLLK
jgi:hypothetical protein